MVLISLPPPRIVPKPLLTVLPRGQRLARLFNPQNHQATALSFRQWGPCLRFDHQRGRNNDPAIPDNDPDRRIYYAAQTLSCCVVEVFGDTGAISAADLKQFRFASPILTRDLPLLDLRGAGSMRVGTVAAIAKTADRSPSQAWSRYFYEDSRFAGIEGIAFSNAHNDEIAFALYERAESALQCSASDEVSLEDPSLHPYLIKAMDDHGLIFI